MRKFAANYLITDHGVFLKNGIVVAGDDGTVFQYIDTTGDLIEIAGLIFHNGILIAGCSFLKSDTPIPDQEIGHPIWMMAIEDQSELSLQKLIDFGMEIQKHFPEMKVSEILNEISGVLQSKAGFVKVDIPGIFLITGVDLPQLHFTSKTRIKKIL